MNKTLAYNLASDGYEVTPVLNVRAMFAMLEHHRPSDSYEDGALSLYFSQQTASLNGKPVALSPMEYKMLRLFCKNPKQVLTRQRLLEKL